MKLEAIHEMWAVDCEIDRKDLFEASLQTPRLHQKYLQLYSQAKARMIMLEMEQKKLLKKKWLYYNGKMTQEEIEAEGWDYDPFKGLKILKGDMDYYYDSDDDIQKSELRIQAQKETIDTIKEIMENLKWRHQTIKNMIEWKKFEAGG